MCCLYIFNLSHADLMIGGASIALSSDRGLSSSVAYSSDNIAWCIASAKQVERWKNMFIIVPTYIWFLFILLAYLGSILLYYLLKYKTGAHYSLIVVCMILLQAVLGQASIFKPRSCCYRAFYFATLVICILCITTYTAFFIKFLTLPIYTRQVESIEELAYYRYTLCGQNETFSFYNLQQDQVRFEYTIPINIKNVQNINQTLHN